MNRVSDWEVLFREAVSLIDQAQVIDHWTFGGGTALMIQLDHRLSHDVDIFIYDPQLLPYLDLAKHDYELDNLPSGYASDGARFSKIAFAGIGEIDFIVSAEMTDDPYRIMKVLGIETKVERIPEVIAKKVHYRGRSIKPRDIFDIAAAARDHEDEIVAALSAMKDEVAATIKTIGKLDPSFVNAVISDLAIKEDFRRTADDALDIARYVLDRSLQVSHPR